jgi:hypothetical protein
MAGERSETGTKGEYKKSAVAKNIRQLSGARRQLFELKSPIQLQNPRRRIQKFDPGQITEVFLISVLLGEGEDFFPFVELVDQFTAHIFESEFTQIILAELDTIADFTNYLRAKETLLNYNRFLIIEGGEEELLAFYLFNERSFARFQKAPEVHITGGFWDKLQGDRRYQLKKKEDEISYGWDHIIDRAHEGSEKYEIVARELARPTRFERRTLAKTIVDDKFAAYRNKTHDIHRSVLCTPTVTYCFLFCAAHIPREGRIAMLQAICYVARRTFLENQKVIGIATEKEISPISSYDFVLLNLPSWTSEDERKVEKLKQELGIFQNPSLRRIEEAEYPDLVEDVSS